MRSTEWTQIQAVGQGLGDVDEAHGCSRPRDIRVKNLMRTRSIFNDGKNEPWTRTRAAITSTAV